MKEIICETWRDAQALAAHSASAPLVKHVTAINQAGTMKIEQFGF